jgi:hypothetical protein
MSYAISGKQYVGSPPPAIMVFALQLKSLLSQSLMNSAPMTNQVNCKTKPI